jgi:hypothetical protein
MGEFVHHGWGTRGGHNKITNIEDIYCIHCGESSIDKLMKDKRRSFGVARICHTCHREKYHQDRPVDKERLWDAKITRGYTVVDGMDYLTDGTFLSWTDVHAKYSPWSLPDGAVIRRNRDGRLFEIINKPQLIAMED